MKQDKDKTLKTIETVLKKILDQNPTATMEQKKHVEKVIESFLEYCRDKYTVQEVLDNMYPVENAMKLFEKYMNMLKETDEKTGD